ncbi:MAG: hypothetical protein ABII90_04725, partial [Bacteroidota bacterium]
LVTGSSQLNNVSAGNISSSYLHTTDSITTSQLTTDTINTASINSSQYLLNGSPFTGSQWINSGSDIYFSGGNVGINTNNPQYPLHVDGNAVVTGSIAGENLYVEKSVNIGAFKFINGAVIPGQKDTISSPAEIVMRSLANKIQFESDTVEAKKLMRAQELNANLVSSDKAVTKEVEAGKIRVDTSIRIAGGGISIDGINNLITSTSGNIYFHDENLITTGSIASRDLYVQRAINIGDFEFRNGATLPGQKDTIRSTVGIVIESDAEKINLSSDSVFVKRVMKAEIIKADTLKTETLETEKEIRVKGMVIDGVNSRITSNSGSINFDDENLITTGSIGGQNLYAQNSLNIGPFKFINGAILPGQKDTIKSPAEIVISSEAEKINLESDTVKAKNVLEAKTLKTATLSAETIESDSAIKVAGSRLIFDGINNRITSASGTISFDDEDLVTTGTITTNRLLTSRIVSPDSLIYFGDSSVVMHHSGNMIYGSVNSLYKGLALEFGTARGLFSTAIGFHAKTSPDAERSVIIGAGVPPNGSLVNDIPFSLMVGFNSDIPTLFVGPSDGTGTTGKVGFGTTDPQKALHIKTTHQINLGDPIPPECPPFCQTIPEAGSHWGIRLEDFTSFDVGSEMHSIFDIEAKFGGLFIGPPGNPMMIFGEVSGQNEVLIDGNLNVSTLNADNLEITDLDVANRIKVGTSSLFLGNPTSTPGDENNIWTDAGDLIVQNHSSNPDGRVGIGTPNPTSKLEISEPSANFKFDGSASTSGYTTTFKMDDTALKIGHNSNGRDIQFFTENSQTTKLTIKPDGKVNIGGAITSGDHTDYKLAVNGKIVAHSYKATISNWGDYVLKKDYGLMTPKEVRNYIDTYGHLPGMPSGKEIETNGLDLGEMALMQ